MYGALNKMVRGILLIFALGFLFQCGKSDDSSKDVDPPPTNVKLSTSEITFKDVDGAVGATYTISVSRPPAAEKTVEVTLISANSLLVVSPTVVRFTSMNVSPQTITVKRANDANDIIMAEIIGEINHDIATGTSYDAEFTEFAMMKSTVNVMVTPTLSNVKLSTPEVTFNDVDGATGATYTILVSRPPSAGKTVEVTLTSANSLLVVSPTKVTFTPTNASPQTITVKRANDANDIIMAEIIGEINHDIATGTSYDAEFTEFAMMKSMVNVRVTPYIPDSDGDGLIEIWNATMLNNMRYDLAGTSYKTSATDPGDSSGCPIGGCNGYELMVNIDLLPLLDANTNGQIDTTTKTIANQVHTVIDVNKDTGWVPVGDNVNQFTGTFEGNGRTIANLWVNISSSGDAHAGLFGRTGGTIAIRNVGVVSGSVFSSSSASAFSYSGGLVGQSTSLTITNSYFSGKGSVFSSSSSSSSAASAFSGGLVGQSTSLTIANSYFSGSGGVSSSSSSYSALSFSGGLVGQSTSLTIANSYFSGSGGVSSSSSSSSLSYSGGLVGRVSSSSSLTITNSYWNTDANQSIDGSPQNPKRARGNSTSDPMGAVGLTLTELKETSGTYPNLLGDAWDLGTDQQLPAVKRCILDMAGVCASYGALLDGQR